MPSGHLITADKCISSCNFGKKNTIVKIFQKIQLLLVFPKHLYICSVEPDLSNIEIVGLGFIS